MNRILSKLYLWLLRGTFTLGNVNDEHTNFWKYISELMKKTDLN